MIGQPSQTFEHCIVYLDVWKTLRVPVARTPWIGEKSNDRQDHRTMHFERQTVKVSV